MKPPIISSYQCPSCQTEFPAEGFQPIASEVRTPSDEDVTQCTVCGEILVFCEQGRRLRVADALEMDAIFRDAPPEWMGS